MEVSRKEAEIGSGNRLAVLAGIHVSDANSPDVSLLSACGYLQLTCLTTTAHS